MLIKFNIFLISILILLMILIFILNLFIFKQGTYAKMTGNSFLETIFDAGKNGEYLTYNNLKLYERNGGKFLFNSYLPKDDGTTTEIDVILIHSTGIFVIESKNYSGWIFGSENSKTWTQTLPRGKGRSQKERFYNPIMQNNTHIKFLKKIIGNNIPIYSIIAFSERCTLKDITVESSNIKVINRQYIGKTVKQMGNNSIHTLSQDDIQRIYEMLYPFTQMTEYEKLQHIDNVNAARYGIKKKPVESDASLESENIIKFQNTIEDNKAEQDNKLTCPRCGSELILRTAKKGEHAGEEFYGCSRFPKCRYTKSIL